MRESDKPLNAILEDDWDVNLRPSCWRLRRDDDVEVNPWAGFDDAGSETREVDPTVQRNHGSGVRSTESQVVLVGSLSRTLVVIPCVVLDA